MNGLDATLATVDLLSELCIPTVQTETLDWPYVYSWADKHGTRELIDRIRQTVPKI